MTSENITPHKIHIRGLDDLSTGDITVFLREHIPSNPHSRVEWIDDTSANIIFPTPALTLKALEQLTSPNKTDVLLSDLQLRAAKAYSARPELSLQIRPALITDQKRPRAYEASRFYMMHPDLDPREKARREKAPGGSGYRRRRYGTDEQRRRKRNDQDEGFDASMYDDGAGLPAESAGRSKIIRTSSSLHSINSSEEPFNPGDRRSRRRGDYFRPGARNRSASPAMDVDEDTQDAPSRRTRRRPPPIGLADERHHVSVQNSNRELFPSKTSMGTVLTETTKQDLFPNKKHAVNLKKELFPRKSHAVHHRRSDAFDAADATADLFANRLAFTKHAGAGEAPKSSSSSYRRLNAEPAMDSVEDGLSIRGTAKQDTGFTIRGVAADGTRVGVIKELFPDKAGPNLGKELFAEKLQGRGGRRNRAEDMFH